MRHIPDLDKNLFSIISVLDRNEESIFTASGLKAKFTDANGKTLATAGRLQKGTLFTMDFTPLKLDDNEAHVVNEDKKADLQYYHEIIGHQNKTHVRNFINQEFQISLPLDNITCKACAIAKSHRLPFAKKRKRRALFPGEI